MKKVLLIAALAFAAFSCSPDDNPVNPNPNPSGGGVVGGIEGFFLLNQGQSGLNNASLDYYSYSTGTYTRDVFSTANPNELGLGDVANDMKIYRDRLYIAVDKSNFVDVVDATNAKLVGKIEMPSPRYVAFEGDYAYVTSWNGATYGNGGVDNEKGYVAKVDLSTLKIAAQCEVGYQPDELAVVGGKLYVANSGGFQSAYETTVSVIDLASFTATGTIDVAPNLWRVRPDGAGKIYVSSRGDYGTNGPATYIIDTATDTVVKGEDEQPLKVVAADNITLGTSTLYAMFVDYPEPDYKATPTYLTYNMATGTVGGSFITDGSEQYITAPYELAIHPASGELLLTDAGDYQRNGVLHRYTPEGKHGGSFYTGVTPAAIAFTTVKLTAAE
jgi:hypothetical protein